MHFVIEKDNQWDTQIYTKIVICKYDYQQFMKQHKKGTTVIINALPNEYFAKIISLILTIFSIKQSNL